MSICLFTVEDVPKLKGVRNVFDGRNISVSISF
jgi:hypothetical protein